MKQKIPVTIKLHHGVSETDTNVYERFKEDMERELFANIMELAAFNQTKAAKILGISRGMFRYRLEELFEDYYLQRKRHYDE